MNNELRLENEKLRLNLVQYDHYIKEAPSASINYEVNNEKLDYLRQKLHNKSK